MFFLIFLSQINADFFLADNINFLRPSALSICAPLREILFLIFFSRRFTLIYFSQIYADFFSTPLCVFICEYLRSTSAPICAFNLRTSA
jgi:hypothetical protein